MRVIGGLSVLLLIGLPRIVLSAEFSGQVVDPDGRPVAGATVWLTGEGWDEPYPVFAETQTDAAGRFVVAHEAQEDGRQGSFAVCTLADGYALAWWGRSRASRPGILLRLGREFPLRGRLVDAAGQAIAGIRPRLSFLSRLCGFDPLEIGQWSTSIGLPESISQRLVAETDAQGEFEVRRLPPGVELNLLVEKPGYARQCVRLDWTDLARGKPIDVKLDPGATIRGRVLRPDGAPVAGVGVAVYSAGQTKTDDQGRYEIIGLPEAVHQVYLRELPLTLTAKAVEVKVRRGSTMENVDLTVVEGLEVKGIVTDQTTGEPVPGVEVCCNTAQQPRAGMGWPTVKTDENGRYSIRAPEGPAQIRTYEMPPGWRAAKPFGSDFRQITVSAAGGPFEENFEVLPVRELTGQVLGPDGKPAAGATVLWMGEDEPGVARTVVCDQQGEFTIADVGPATAYALGAYLGEDMTVEPCPVGEGDFGPITLTLEADTRPAVGGCVLAGDGKPVPYALVQADGSLLEATGAAAGAAASWRAPMVQTLTDQEGDFLLEALFPGLPLTLRVRAAGFAQTELKAPAPDPGGVVDVGDIALEAADLIATGRVVDDKGLPVPNVRVDAKPLSGAVLMRSITTLTDLDGHFRLEDLPRAGVRLVVDASACDGQPVEVRPGLTEVTITAIPRAHQLLYTHQLEPAMEVGGAALRALCRFKGVGRAGSAEQFLALDLGFAVGGQRVPRPRAVVVDDHGRELAEAPSLCQIGQRMLRGYDLPQAGTRSVTVTVQESLLFPDIPIPEELTRAREF